VIAVGAVTPLQLLLILSCLATIFQAIDDPLSPRAAPGRCSRAPLQMVSRITRPALSRFSAPLDNKALVTLLWVPDLAV